MRLGIGLTALFLAFVIAAPSYGQDEKKKPVTPDDLLGKKDEKKDPKKKAEPKKPEVNKFTYGQTFGGKLVNMANGQLTIQITTNLKVPYPDAGRRLLNWQRDIANRKNSIARERNPFRRQQLIAQLQQKMAQPPQLYKIEKKTQDVIVPTGKDMKVRVAFPEPQYDEKGALIKLTAQKLKELQGNEGYPGYPADFNALHNGVLVQVYLSNPKVDSQKKKKGVDISDIIGGSKEEPGVGVEPNPNLPQVVAIVILGESK